MNMLSFGRPTDEIVSDEFDNTESVLYDGHEITDEDICYWEVNAPEHCRRGEILQIDSDEFDNLNPTELARHVIIGHAIAHRLNHFRASGTPLESDTFIIYSRDGLNQSALGDIRDPKALKSLLNVPKGEITLIGYSL